MKRKLLALIGALLMISSVQSRVGIVLGLTQGNFDVTSGQEFDGKLSFEAGFVHRVAKAGFSLMTELTYSSYKGEDNDPTGADELESTYINLRPLMAFGLTSSMEFLLGATIGYNLDRTITDGADGSEGDFNNFQNFDTSDFRLALNAGFGFPIATSFGIVAPRIMYEYGITKDIEGTGPNAGYELKNSAIQFGFDIFL